MKAIWLGDRVRTTATARAVTGSPAAIRRDIS